jgi:hypothetical protein
MTITLTREEAAKMLHYMDDGGTYTDDYGKLIETLRARLAQPEPEPVAGYRWEEGRTPPSVTFTAPPQPEPPCKTGSQCIGGKCPQCVVSEWQGLTDAEAEQIVDDYWHDVDMFIEAIENKLKEKNYDKS